jgi:hypothetical protein
MKTGEIRKKLHNYIDVAEEKKLKAIYTMVEDDMGEYDHLNDEDFVKEMKRRMTELETGKTKGYTWNEVKKKAMKKTKLAKVQK